MWLGLTIARSSPASTAWCRNTEFSTARAGGEGDRHHPVELRPPGLEVDRVDDRPAGDLLERGLDHLGLGGVDLDRRRLGQRDPLRDLPHLAGLVLALGERD